MGVVHARTRDAVRAEGGRRGGAGAAPAHGAAAGDGRHHVARRPRRHLRQPLNLLPTPTRRRRVRGRPSAWGRVCLGRGERSIAPPRMGGAGAAGCGARGGAGATWTFFLESSRGTSLRFSADSRSYTCPRPPPAPPRPPPARVDGIGGRSGGGGGEGAPHLVAVNLHHRHPHSPVVPPISLPPPPPPRAEARDATRCESQEAPGAGGAGA